jgi:transcription-repair coupling factor (superfamily II helicase)
LHKISKYNGKDGTTKIYKLGSNAWKILKQNQSKSKHVVQFDSVVCQRRLDKGSVCARQLFAKRLESSFIYEDTPDQTKSTQGKSRYGRPTNGSFGCGDVGFGKTEVAIRAASKAVDNSKQVAILVPTTI